MMTKIKKGFTKKKKLKIKIFAFHIKFYCKH